VVGQLEAVVAHGLLGDQVLGAEAPQRVGLVGDRIAVLVGEDDEEVGPSGQPAARREGRLLALGAAADVATPAATAAPAPCRNRRLDSDPSSSLLIVAPRLLLIERTCAAGYR
jgi:hypothetical protein